MALGRALALLLLSVPALACADEEAGIPAGFNVTDSAGVSIVESFGPPREANEWLIGPDPLLEIATHSSDSRAVIHWVRGLARMSDGRIAVLSESAHNLRFFDASGTLVGVVGGEGGGPGEFRFPNQLYRMRGDTLVVGEGRGSRRFSSLTGDGNFIGVEHFSPEGVVDLPAGFTLRETRFVAPGAVLWRFDQPGPTTVFGRRHRDPRAYYLIRGGQDAVLLGWFEDWETFALDQQWARWAFFYENAYVAVGGDPPRVYIGDSEQQEIRAYDDSGRLIQVIRDAMPPPVITDADIEWERWEVLDWGEQTGALREWTRFADAMPIPDRKPAFEDLLVDSEGFLWVKEYSPYSPQPVAYRIYSPDGRRVAQAQVPGRIKLYDIGRDYLLGLHTDIEYIESIVMFELQR